METVRFELTVHVATYDRLATCCLRPLGHVSYVWCLHLDSNQEPSDYESLATNQLCYRGIILWCEWRDLNPQSLRRKILSLVCIPIPPHSLVHYPPRPVTFLTGLPTGCGAVFLTDLEPLAGFASGCCAACFFSNADFTAVINEAMILS